MNNTDIYWPGWTTVKKIGSGGFGAVYEIQRELLGDTEKAALKVITIPAAQDEIDELYGEGYDMQSLTSRYIGQRDDVLREYQLMQKLKGHTHVVNCNDIQYSQHSDGMGWDIKIKMELLTPLTKLPPEHFTEEQIIKLGSDMCDALILCKMNSIIHRDIKPQNIFISNDGEYKLGDFGIARTMEHTSSGTKIGTYKFMAPEVYNNQPYNATVDIYSLGLVLYWLLNGRRMPFLRPGVINPAEEDEARRRRLSGDAIPAPVNGSRELQRIVLKACEYDAGRRWQTAEEMKQALDTLLYGAVRSTAAEMPKRAEVPKPKAEAPKPAPEAEAKNVYSAWQSTETKSAKKPRASKIKAENIDAPADRNRKLARLRFIPPVFMIVAFFCLGSNEEVGEFSALLYLGSVAVCYYVQFPWRDYVDETRNHITSHIFSPLGMMMGDAFIGVSGLMAYLMADESIYYMFISAIYYPVAYLFRGFPVLKTFREDIKKGYRRDELVSYVAYYALAFILGLAFSK